MRRSSTSQLPLFIYVLRRDFSPYECVFVVVVHFFLQKFSFRFSQKKVKYERLLSSFFLSFFPFLSRDDEDEDEDDEDDDGLRDPARRG